MKTTIRTRISDRTNGRDASGICPDARMPLVARPTGPSPSREILA